VIPYSEIPFEARAALDSLISAYLNQVGCPPRMTREEARRGIILLIEKGLAVFVHHGELGDPECEYSLKIKHA
jgi:hypothetical protein